MGAGESPMMDSAYSLTPEEIAAAVEACGEKPWRAAQVCQWLYGGRAERWDAMANVPAALRQALSARLRDLDGTARVQEVAAEGGATTKLLLGLLQKPANAAQQRIARQERQNPGGRVGTGGAAKRGRAGKAGRRCASAGSV